MRTQMDRRAATETLPLLTRRLLVEEAMKHVGRPSIAYRSPERGMDHGGFDTRVEIAKRYSWEIVPREGIIYTRSVIGYKRLATREGRYQELLPLE
ncbi:hypothetical protein HZC07_03865 [Candidatus Micrarchaeota archaeon]|nr:hypothetical protein [Candidatus Micrarchaeota archaeon]